MVIIFDGPEKTGKSTLIKALIDRLYLEGTETSGRHWGPIDPDDRVYAKPLQTDLTVGTDFTFWDRSWASEAVYAKLLNRNRRLKTDPLLGELIHGRPVLGRGLRIMIMGDNQMRKELLDETDLQVDPSVEYAAFERYAQDYNWIVLRHSYTREDLEYNVNRILRFMTNTMHSMPNADPMYWVGRPEAECVVVSSKYHVNPIPGTWAAGTGRNEMAISYLLGNDALNVSWGVAHQFSPTLLRGKIVFAIGREAALWVRNYATYAERTYYSPNVSVPKQEPPYGSPANKLIKIFSTMN